jgi:hypothetical protein
MAGIRHALTEPPRQQSLAPPPAIPPGLLKLGLGLVAVANSPPAGSLAWPDRLKGRLNVRRGPSSYKVRAYIEDEAELGVRRPRRVLKRHSMVFSTAAHGFPCESHDRESERRDRRGNGVLFDFAHGCCLPVG